MFLVFGAVLAVFVMVSSATAVPQTKSVENFEKPEYVDEIELKKAEVDKQLAGLFNDSNFSMGQFLFALSKLMFAYSDLARVFGYQMMVTLFRLAGRIFWVTGLVKSLFPNLGNLTIKIIRIPADPVSGIMLP